MRDEPACAQIRPFLGWWIDACHRRAACAQSWSAGGVGDFLRTQRAPICTAADLHRRVRQVLDDLKDHIEHGDTTGPDRVPPPADENIFQRFLCARLQAHLTAVREVEVRNGKKMDILIFSPPNLEHVLELKIADHYSYAEFFATMSDQLIGRYLRPAPRQYGHLVLAYTGRKTYWEINGSRADFAGLTRHLDEHAAALSRTTAYVPTIAVVGIDFSAGIRQAPHSE